MISRPAGTVVRYAFEYDGEIIAAGQLLHQRTHEATDGFSQVFTEIAAEYPDLEDDTDLDIGAAKLANTPSLR